MGCIMNKIKAIILAMTGVVVIMLFSGCSYSRMIFEVPDLKAELQNRLDPSELAQLEVPYATTPEMEEFARKTIRHEDRDIDRAIALVEAVVSRWELDTEYDPRADLTAKEVYELHRANCLAFTNLFVGLSRSVGLRTVYVDVRQIEDIYLENNIIVNSGHICAGLYDSGQFYLIDFARIPQKDYRIFTEIDDFEALANHYNNLAYRQHTHDEAAMRRAIEYYDLAIKIKPGFTRAYNNKGATLSLLNEMDAARRAYSTALAEDPRMPEANCNLGSLYFSESNYKQAEIYLKRAVRTRPRNPQYRYRLGLTYYFSGNMKAAKRELRAAIKYNRKFAKAWLGLAMIARHNDNYVNTLKYLKKAYTLDPDLLEARIQYYNLVRDYILMTWT